MNNTNNLECLILSFKLFFYYILLLYTRTATAVIDSQQDTSESAFQLTLVT